MAFKQPTPAAASVAKQAVQALGRGYDVTSDLRLNYCKGDPGSCLIELDDKQTQDLVVPGGVVVPNVSTAIKCDKGDRMRFRSDVLSFNEMSEQFNQTLSISGKIPLGLFNATFGYSGVWQRDASTTKTLAMDGWFITLYSMELPRSQLVLREEVKKAVPSSWDPAALASFVEKYGTHITVGVKIGGKDAIYLKQQPSSPLSSIEIQKILEKKAGERFLASESRSSLDSREKVNTGRNAENLAWMDDTVGLTGTGNPISLFEKDEVTVSCKRRGGRVHHQSHNEWLYSVPLAPDVISMSFVPITTLLNGVTGSGFLSHAVNLYLRYKPPVEELRHFLEFQLPKEWAPVFNELPLGPPRKQRGSPSLQFRLMGPKLQINTSPVRVEKKPVTGLRLYLEGKKSNRLAIHLQHLSVLPQILQPLWEDDHLGRESRWQVPDDLDHRYFEPVMWKSFSHVCTAPVENNEIWIGEPGAFVVVGAQLEVEEYGTKKVLVLKLLYSRIPKARIRRSEWDHTPASQQKSGLFSSLISTTFSSVQPTAKPAQVIVNSAIYPEGPPVPGQAPKLLKFVDTTEMTKGPQDMPGHWLVTGAKLFVDRGKISLRVKYSLLFYSID